MELGFVSAVLHDLSFDEVLSTASELGYDCVEVMCWPREGYQRKYGGVSHLDVSDWSQGKADDIRARTAEWSVEISALGYYANSLSSDPEDARLSTEHLKRVIAAAPTLGLQQVNAFVGANHTLSLDENFQLFEQVWPDIVRYAEDQGVRIGIENCPMLFADSWPFGKNMARSPAIWRRMFETIPSDHFGLNYDPSHLVMQLVDPIAPIREFGTKIFHTHAKDMRIDQHRLDDVGSLVPPMERATAKIPGLGAVDWGAWISALTDAGYNGPVCVEVEDHAFEPELIDRKRSLDISQRYLRPWIA